MSGIAAGRLPSPGSSRKYIRIFGFSVRNAIAYIPSFLLRNIFLVIILFVFYSLWRVVYGGRPQLSGFTMTQLVWYLAFTESIELSRSRVLWEVQEEVKDGTLAYNMQRPYSYVGYHFFRSLGESIVKMGPILIVGGLVSLILAGPLPGLGISWVPGIVVLLLGVVLNTTWLIGIALLAFWTEEVLPFYWILQKLTFIIGGMFFPIDLFPAWMRGIAESLPFAFAAYWPARVLVAFSWHTLLVTLAGQLLYIAAVGGVALGFYHLGARRVLQQGG